jgi:hypothetical protein
MPIKRIQVKQLVGEEPMLRLNCYLEVLLILILLYQVNFKAVFLAAEILGLILLQLTMAGHPIMQLAENLLMEMGDLIVLQHHPR